MFLALFIVPFLGAVGGFYYGVCGLICSRLCCRGEVWVGGKLWVKKNKKYFHLDVPKLISWRIYLQRNEFEEINYHLFLLFIVVWFGHEGTKTPSWDVATKTQRHEVFDTKGWDVKDFLSMLSGL